MTFEAQHQFVANPEIALETLRELSRSDDRAIRQTVAGNPNTPIDVLWNLMTEFPNEIVANPLFALIALENPDWIIDIPGENLLTLLQQNFLALLQQAKPSKIVIAAALNCMGYDDDGYDIDQYGREFYAIP